MFISNFLLKENFYFFKNLKKNILNINLDYNYFNYIFFLENKKFFYYKNQITFIKENYLRFRAEFENFKKKSSEEISKSYKYSIEEFSENLLVVLDSLESTLSGKFFKNEDILEGVRLTLKIFLKVMNNNDVFFILPDNNEIFNPHKHLAISTVSCLNKDNNVIINTLQKGYYISERILRPALVVVNKV